MDTEADPQRLVKSLSGGDLSRAAGVPAGPPRERRVPAVCPAAAAGPSPGSTEATSLRLFSPFPRQYVNKRRVDNAIRLGLYTVDGATAAAPTLKTTSASGGRSSARHPHS